MSVIRFPTRLTPEQQRLVADNASLVEVIAKDLVQGSARAVPIAELVAVGRDGLVRAALAYSADRKVAFRTFAWSRVSGAMRDLIRRDARRAAVAKRAWRGVEDFAEMARSDGSAMDSDEKVMADIDTAGREAMDSMLFALGLPAAPSPEDEYLDRELRAELIEAVRHLPTDFQRVVEARFGEERELDDVAAALNLSSSTARRRQSEAIQRLRALLEARGALEKRAG